jgi:WG containing repeat
MSKQTITKAEFEELSKVMDEANIIRKYNIEPAPEESKPIHAETKKNKKPLNQTIIILFTIIILVMIGGGIWYYQYDQELNRYETIAAETYKNGLMKVQKNNKIALINENKKLINRDVYDEANPEQEYYKVKKDGRWNLVKKDGRYTLPEWVDWVDSPKDIGKDENNQDIGKGYKVWLNNEQNIFLHNTNKMLFPKYRNNFDDVSDFSKGVARARLNNKWGYIKTEGS